MPYLTLNAAKPGSATTAAHFGCICPILLRRLKRAHNGELALLCLAALHDELPVDDKVFAKGAAATRQGELRADERFVVSTTVGDGVVFSRLGTSGNYDLFVWDLPGGVRRLTNTTLDHSLGGTFSVSAQ